jgi:hypothetical protein
MDDKVLRFYLFFLINSKIKEFDQRNEVLFIKIPDLDSCVLDETITIKEKSVQVFGVG